MSDTPDELLRTWLRDIQAIDVGAADLADPVAAFARAGDAVRDLAKSLPFEVEPSAFLTALDDLAPKE